MSRRREREGYADALKARTGQYPLVVVLKHTVRMRASEGGHRQAQTPRDVSAMADLARTPQNRLGS